MKYIKQTKHIIHVYDEARDVKAQSVKSLDYRQSFTQIV